MWAAAPLPRCGCRPPSPGRVSPTNCATRESFPRRRKITRVVARPVPNRAIRGRFRADGWAGTAAASSLANTPTRSRASYSDVILRLVDQEAQGLNPSLTTLRHHRPQQYLMGRVAMVVLRFREAAEETGTGKSTMWRAIKSGRMSAELTEDGGTPNASLRQLTAPETIATNDLAAKLAAADAAISNIQELLGGVKTSYEELRQALDDLERDRDEWRGRAERLTERPWWRRLAG